MTAASRQQASAGRINPNWIHYAAAALLGAIVIGNVLRWGILGEYLENEPGRESLEDEMGGIWADL